MSGIALFDPLDGLETVHFSFPATPDRSGIAAWVLLSLPTITRLARQQGRRLGLVPDLAGEIASEAVEQILQGNSRPQVNVGAWLFDTVRTASNTVASSYGRSRPGRQRRLAQIALGDEERLDAIESRGTPEQSMLEGNDLLAALSAEEGALVNAAICVGESHASIGQRMGVSRQTVDRRVAEALRKCRRLAGVA